VPAETKKQKISIGQDDSIPTETVGLVTNSPDDKIQQSQIQALAALTSMKLEVQDDDIPAETVGRHLPTP